MSTPAAKKAEGDKPEGKSDAKPETAAQAPAEPHPDTHRTHAGFADLSLGSWAGRKSIPVPPEAR